VLQGVRQESRAQSGQVHPDGEDPRQDEVEEVERQ